MIVITHSKNWCSVPLFVEIMSTLRLIELAKQNSGDTLSQLNPHHPTMAHAFGRADFTGGAMFVESMVLEQPHAVRAAKTMTLAPRCFTYAGIIKNMAEIDINKHRAAFAERKLLLSDWYVLSLPGQWPVPEKILPDEAASQSEGDPRGTVDA
jgi:hypothetical protein